MDQFSCGLPLQAIVFFWAKHYSILSFCFCVASFLLSWTAAVFQMQYRSKAVKAKKKHAVLVYGHQLYNHDLALQSPCRHVCSYSGFLTPLPPAPSKLAQSKGSLEHPSRQNAECFALFFCSVSSGVCRETITCPSHVAGKPS